MVNCSSLRKEPCSQEEKCKWEKGKGCRSTRPRTPKAEKKPAVAPVNNVKKNDQPAFEVFKLGNHPVAFFKIDAEKLVPIKEKAKYVNLYIVDNLNYAKLIVTDKKDQLPKWSYHHPKIMAVSTFMKHLNECVKIAEEKKTNVPKGFFISKFVELPMRPLSLLPREKASRHQPEWLQNAPVLPIMRYDGIKLSKILNQGKHIVESILVKREKLRVRDIANFLGYSVSEQCFVFIAKVGSKAPDAPYHGFDLIAAEIKYEAKNKETGKPGWTWLGYRPLMEGIAKTDFSNDAHKLITSQYKKDLFTIFKANKMFMREPDPKDGNKYYFQSTDALW